MIPANEALARLRAGNLRFIAGQQQQQAGIYAQQHADLVEGQQPFAIILGCSDSRVPAEMVFDQGFGSLFVIRVAGNIVAPSQIGSVEFAAEMFGTQLVVVLGHTQCGAIAGAIDELSNPQAQQSPNLRSIVGRIVPAIKPLFNESSGYESEALKTAAVHANARASARDLVSGSSIIRKLVASGDLMIASAEYSIETGKVTFLDDPDSSANTSLPRRA
ncbi:MAG: carbonic anhydrase, partial [Gammaproteobacteria bacterium]|nr:carbonic anhydrase [Gammaproteobacteria bacterium]